MGKKTKVNTIDRFEGANLIADNGQPVVKVGKFKATVTEIHNSGEYEGTALFIPGVKAEDVIAHLR